MEAVLLVGVQGSGKSSFYRERLGDTHVRVSLDAVRTRSRERKLVETCLRNGRRFVVDNTNARREDRARYVSPAKEAGFRVVGYFFPTTLEAALERNAERSGRARVPNVAVVATFKRLEPPTVDEGFDRLYVVRIDGGGGFKVDERAAADSD